MLQIDVGCRLHRESSLILHFVQIIVLVHFLVKFMVT